MKKYLFDEQLGILYASDQSQESWDASFYTQIESCIISLEQLFVH